MAQLHLTTGKAEFVKRKKPNGELENICLGEYNADISTACPAQVYGKHILEVIKNNGAYDEGNIEKYRKEGTIDGRCTYCYEKRKNWGKITPKEIGEKTREEFETKKPAIIRMAKETECGHYFYQEQLKQFLELCKEYGTKVIFPTKALEFDEEIAELLIETKSVLNYSLCRDESEPGIVSQGFSNAWRVQQAIKYFGAGVNTTATLTCDITNSIDGNLKRGFAIDEMLNAKDMGVPTRLLPLRIYSKKVCLEATGRKWEEIVLQNKDQEHFDFGFEWRYIRVGGNKLIPLFFHNDFQKLADEGIGVCGRIGDYEYCDHCNLHENVRIKFPISELAEVKRSKNKLKYKRYKTKKEITEDKTQIELFEN
jgi:hypothetical protein